MGRPQHEFGHLIGGLFDEYDFSIAPYNGTYQGPPGPPVDTKNCSTAASPYWHTDPRMAGVSPTPPDPVACNHYHLGIKRPYVDCRMNVDTDLQFCQICDRVMKYALDGMSAASPTNLRIIGIQNQRPAPAPPSVRLLVRVSRNGAAAKVLTATEVNDPYVPHQKRLGDFAYEIVDGAQVVDTGVFPGEPFETRGEGSAKQARAAQTEESAAVVIYVPRATIATLQARNVSINFYRLKPVQGFGEEVTPAVLSKLKPEAARSGSLSTSDLKGFLAQMPTRRR
jgi:hypothetical protein